MNELHEGPQPSAGDPGQGCSPRTMAFFMLPRLLKPRGSIVIVFKVLAFFICRMKGKKAVRISGDLRESRR